MEPWHWNHHKLVWAFTELSKRYASKSGINHWRGEQLSIEGRQANFADQCEKIILVMWRNG